MELAPASLCFGDPDLTKGANFLKVRVLGSVVLSREPSSEVPSKKWPPRPSLLRSPTPTTCIASTAFNFLPNDCFDHALIHSKYHTLPIGQIPHIVCHAFIYTISSTPPHPPPACLPSHYGTGLVAEPSVPHNFANARQWPSLVASLVAETVVNSPNRTIG